MAPYEAVLLDALGTLIELLPPWEPLAAGLASEHGVEVSVEEAMHAVVTEMTYYRAHCDEAHDQASLHDLRLRCTEVLRDALPAAAHDLALEPLGATLLESLRFRPYAEAPDALRALRDAGLRLVVVSNWDVSLHEQLRSTGLAALVDGAVSSAEVGAAKPEPAIFVRALELAGAPPERALMVGDTLEGDIEGAAAAGIDAVLVQRDGGEPPAGVRSVRSLAELPALAT